MRRKAQVIVEPPIKLGPAALVLKILFSPSYLLFLNKIPEVLNMST